MSSIDVRPDSASVSERTPDENSRCAERDRLENIGAATNAAVEKNRHTILHSVANFRECIERRDCAVNLTTTVIRNDDSVCTMIDCSRSIAWAQYSLQENRQLRRLLQPFDVIPRKSRI